jgi:tetratricopeptide (TPR) repeat protein
LLIGLKDPNIQRNLTKSFAGIIGSAKNLAGQETPSPKALPTAAPPGAGESENKAQVNGNENENDAPGSTMSLIDEAVKELQNKIKLQPNSAVNYNRLGLIFAQMGEMDLAADNFTQAIGLCRVQLNELNNKLALCQKKQNKAEASQMVLAISQAEIDLCAAHSSLARVYEKLGEQNKVVSQLEQLNSDIALGAGSLISQSTQEKLQSNLKATKPKEAVVVGLAQAKALAQVGRLDDAILRLRQVIQLSPDLAQAHEELGKLGLATNNSFLAVQELRKAAELEPAKATTHAALGIAYQLKNKNVDAVGEFQKALNLNSKDPVTAYNLGNAYCQLGQNSQAVKYYSKAAALNPNLAEAHNNIASIYAAQGRYQQAIEKFEETLSINPNLASAHYGLGIALYNEGDCISASREFKKALALNPNLADAHAKIEACYKRNATGGIRTASVVRTTN